MGHNSRTLLRMSANGGMGFHLLIVMLASVSCSAVCLQPICRCQAERTTRWVAATATVRGQRKSFVEDGNVPVTKVRG